MPFQKTFKKGFLNKTYIEKARRNVESSLWEQYFRSIKAICEAIHNINKVNFWKQSDLKRFEKNKEIIPKYKFVQVDLQDKVNQKELDEIKALFGKVNTKERLDWLRGVIFNNDNKNLNNNQILIIKNAY